MGMTLTMREPRKATPQDLQDILFYGFLGLGDQIVCNGIVHWLLEKHGPKIFVTSKERNYENVAFMYKDHPDIIPVKIPSDPAVEGAEVDKVATLMGLTRVNTWISGNGIYADNNWEYEFYAHRGLSYDVKYDYCKLPIVDEEKILRECPINTDKDYAFMYDDPERGFTYPFHTELPVIKNQTNLNIFEMMPIMAKAKELHMMAGGLICVADLMGLPLPHQTAYFYPFRGNFRWRGKDKWILK